MLKPNGARLTSETALLLL
jgi:hypothetical protein